MNQPISLNSTNHFNPFSGPEIERVIHTTPPQAEIWIACKLGGNDANRAYNESVSLIFKGPLYKDALEHALEKLVLRHESLRAVFSTDGRFMSIFANVPIPLSYQDVSTLSVSDQENEVASYLTKDAQYVFDLVQGPLLKVGLIKLNELEHQLIITAHHIICDGWSIGMMLQELSSLYSAKLLNTTPSLPKPESFVAFSDEQQEFLESEEYQKTEQFWLQQFQSSIPQVSLPTDFPRPALRTYKSNRLDFIIEPELISALKKTGLKAGASFVSTLMVAFELFLYKQTNQTDLVVGLPSAGQSSMGKPHLVGHCVNLLPLRSKMDTNSSFNDYLKLRKSQLFDAYEHQRLSFGQLLQKLAIARDPSRVPLVPVVFNIDLGMTDDVLFTDLTYTFKSNPRAYETFELFLNASGTEDAFILEWSYNASLFKPETIQQMMATFKDLLNRIVAQPQDSIGHIVQTDYSAYQNLNKTEAAFPNLPLHELLREQAQTSTAKQALKFHERTISYQDLEEQTNQLAHKLTEQGIKSGDFIGVALPRSIELIMVLKAIMQCGAAYVPLDPNYPRKRLEFMLNDSEAQFLITTKDFSLALESTSSLLILEDLFSNLSTYPKTPLNLKVAPTEIAYLLYTSGSTGNPKGVPITHRNLVNFLYSMSSEPGIKETDRLLSITTISFDIAGLELFLPLLTGATLIIADDETVKDTRLMLDLLQKEHITLLQATPSTWQMLLDSGWEKPLALKALCGGEALPMVLAKKIVNLVSELWNVYGPTETTIWSTIKQIKMDDALITIGHPIANTQVYILNEEGFLVPPGTHGELCIAGDGLAKGYWKRPDLTSEKFITNTFGPHKNTALYRTGDLAKLLPSGEIQCLGRIDQQVKIRGHRIELEEIEKALDLLEGVQTSVVLLNGDRLIANLILNAAKNSIDDETNSWKQALAEQLPTHMIPQEYHVLTAFPKTLNGKIDRKALLASIATKAQTATYTPPRNKTEQLIATIWQECLEIGKIDIHSDFFELGGHSLIAVKVMALLEKETQIRLPLSALFEYPSIAKLANFMEMDNPSAHWDSLVPIKPEGNKTPLYIIHGAEYNVLTFNGLAKNLDPDQPVYGLQAKGLNGIDEPHTSVEEMVTDYISEILSANPQGPYALAGYSFGGIAAFEMARQLKTLGKEVTTVVLFDSYVYPSYFYTNTLVKKAVSNIYILGQVIFALRIMLSSKKRFFRRINLMKASVHKLFLRMKYGREKQHQMLYNWPLKLDDMHRVIMDRYHIVPQDIEVHLFKAAEDDIFFAHNTKHLGWKKLALKGVSKYITPGNHREMFSPPYDKKLAKILQRILDEHDTKPNV